jgi:surface antigen Omp85-like protein
MRRFPVAAALILWSHAAAAQFVDPGLSWRTLDTEHFSVHFAEHTRSQARIVAEVAESVYPRVTGWLGWMPRSRTHVVVLDSLDLSNGLASPVPFNYVQIVLTPPDDGELLQNREWLELVLTHEFTHIAHLDKGVDDPLALRRIFGRMVLLFPNLLEPRWVTEGLAVYSESDPGKGYGRLGQSRFEGQMRAEAGRGLRSLREVNAEGRGFPLNRDYLYGGYFFAFLAERYGPAAVNAYVEGYSDNLIPFRVDSNPAGVTGKHMDELWDEYRAWLAERFAAKPRIPPDGGGEIIARAWSLSSPLLGADGTRWYVSGDGYTLPRLMRQAPGGEAAAVAQVESQTRLAASTRGEPLLSKLEVCANYNLYYDLYRLGARGALERVTRCGRFRFAAPLDDGRIVATRITGGTAEVLVLDRDGAEERVLYRAARGEELAGLAASGDAVAVTSLREGRWSLLEIRGGRASVLVSDAAVKHFPRYAESGDEIYFVANYGNVENVWSWRRGERRLARWSAATNGVREISAPVAGTLLVTTLEADGDALRLHRLPEAPLEVREPEAVVEPVVPAPPAPAAEDDRPYSPWSSLAPTSWLPAAYIADGAFALGFQTYGQDALGLHVYTLAPLYEFTQQQGLGSASWVYNDRHGVLLNRFMTVKTSVADSQKFTGRDVTAYTIDELAQWVSLWRQLSLATRWYGGLGAALDREVLHDLGFGTVTPRDERVLGLLAGVDTTRKQFLSEGPSQGQQLRLFGETSNGLRGAYSGNFYRSDLRAYLPAGPTVVAARWNQAYSQADAEPIQLGGSFSEEIAGFDLPVLDQRQFPLRGYRSGEAVLTGRHAFLGSLEWRAPLTDLDRHIMVPPVGADRLSMTVFFDVGSAWNDGAAQRTFKSAGLEFLAEVRAGYLLGLQYRAGVARGFEAPGATVAYLQIGRSF